MQVVALPCSVQHQPRQGAAKARGGVGYLGHDCGCLTKGWHNSQRLVAVDVPRKVAKLGDAAWLRQCYLAEEASIAVIAVIAVIAAELGCAIASVRSALAAAVIPLRPSGPRRKLSGPG